MLSDFSKIVPGSCLLYQQTKLNMLTQTRWRDAVQATTVLGVLAIELSHESMILHDTD